MNNICSRFIHSNSSVRSKIFHNSKLKLATLGVVLFATYEFTRNQSHNSGINKNDHNNKDLVELHTDAIKIFDAALKAADPYSMVHNTINYDPQSKKLIIQSNNETLEYPIGNKLDEYNNIIVIGAGKASVPMAIAAEEILSDIITTGHIITKYNHYNPQSNVSHSKLSKISVTEGGHPVLDDNSINGTKRILDIINNYSNSPNTLVIFLLSGGASSLLAAPANNSNITLSDMQQTNQVLLKSGCNINEMNTIRKHISSISGGRLAQSANKATIISLILSDVIGDELTVIGSGPTVADPTTFEQCFDIVAKYSLDKPNQLPKSVLTYLLRGLTDKSLESPKQINSNTVKNIIIGSNLLSLQAAQNQAHKLGYNTLILSDRIEGEAKDIAKLYSAIAQSVQTASIPISKPAVIIAGGETTVTLNNSNNGIGGRNQELALSAAIEIANKANTVILSGGSDGSDGPNNAAGAIVTGNTTNIAQRYRLNASDYLARHDSYNFFKKYDQLIGLAQPKKAATQQGQQKDINNNTISTHIITGPTGTNVMDIALIVVN